MYRYYTIIALLTLCFLTVSAQNIDTPKIIDGIIDNTEWQCATEPQTYQGDNLFALINGGADIFLEYGFQEVVAVDLIHKETNVHVEIYKMRDNDAAYGIFSLNALPDGKTISLQDETISYGYYILMRKAHYYISISGHDDSPTTQEKLETLAKLISDEIPESAETPKIITDLKNIFPEAEDIDYVKGQLGILNISPFSPSIPFSFIETVKITTKDAQIFVMMYNDEEDVSETLNSFQEKYEGMPLSQNSSIIECGIRSNKNAYVHQQGTKLIIIIGPTYSDEIASSFNLLR